MTISLRVGLVDWQTDTLSLCGLGIEIAFAAGYLACAAKARRAGRPWPVARSVSFVVGLGVLALSLQSGFSTYDEIFWVHVVQHQLLMALAPALLMLGAPVILVLRILPASRARKLVGVLHHRLLNWMNGPSAAVHLPLHYYGIMFVYLLTPAYALGQRNEVFHEVVHLYFIGCGLMFWLPVLGRYPSRWHPSYQTKIRMVAIGLPINLVLAAILAARSPVSSTTTIAATSAGIWALIIGSVVVTGIGLVLVRFARHPQHRPAVQIGLLPPASAMAASRRA